MSQCPNCGATVQPNQLRCHKCGSTLQLENALNPAPAHGVPNAGPGMESLILIWYILDPPKSSTTALILSCLITGLGQIYLGQTIKGLVLLISSFVISGITLGFGWPILWIVAMVDAHMIGNKLASGQPVRQWEFF